MKLPKTHFYDEVAIASQTAEVKFVENSLVILKKSVSKGNNQLSKGKRSEKRITTGTICGFRKFDKVLYNGEEYFIKGRMSTRYAILMDICGQKVALKPFPKFVLEKGLSVRNSWIIPEQTIASFC